MQHKRQTLYSKTKSNEQFSYSEVDGSIDN